MKRRQQVWKHVFVVLATLLALGTDAWADGASHERPVTTHRHGKQTQAHEHEERGSDHHAFAHPLLVHMGLPDAPGEVDIRANTFITKFDRGDRVDFGGHLEAGLIDRLGLHVRSDGIKDQSFSEAMLQYAVLRDASKQSGVSVFGQVNVQTKEDTRDPLQSALGISFRQMLYPLTVLDGNVHYNLNEDAWELEGSSVFRLTDRLFPLFELHAEIHDNEQVLNVLPGLKVQLTKNVFLGGGVQIPVTREKEFDVQGIIQVEVMWH